MDITAYVIDKMVSLDSITIDLFTCIYVLFFNEFRFGQYKNPTRNSQTRLSTKSLNL